MMTTARTLTSVLAAACWTGSALGVGATPATGVPRGPSVPGQHGVEVLRVDQLKRVEAFVADRGALDAGGRVLAPDRRLPQDFETLYQIPKDAPTKYAGWFVRAGGAVVAVFPQSTYGHYTDRNKKVTYVFPTVPPGTVFLVGGIPIERPGNESTPQVSTEDSRVDLRESRQVGSRIESWDDVALLDGELTRRLRGRAYEPGTRLGPEHIAEQHRLVTERMFSDERYAAQRIAQRLRQVTREHETPQADPAPSAPAPDDPAPPHDPPTSPPEPHEPSDEPGSPGSAGSAAVPTDAPPATP